MKKYNYEARDSASNKIVKSVVQAESENAAAKLLTTQGFVPLKIELQDDKTGFFAKLSGRITTKDKVVFTRQLATLIGAGLPLSQSLRTVQEQTTNKRMQEIVQEIISDVEGGKSLSDSFAKHPEAFNKVYSCEFQHILKNVVNPYGDGCASKKIIDIIKNVNLANILKKSFYDLKVDL